MDEELREDIEALAATLEDRAEAAALVDIFAAVSGAAYEPPREDEYVPFVYPH